MLSAFNENVLFFFRYAYRKPVILKGLTDNTVSSGAKLTRKYALTDLRYFHLIIFPYFETKDGFLFYSRNSDFCAQSQLYSDSLETERWSSAQQTLTLTGKVCMWNSAF